MNADQVSYSWLLYRYHNWIRICLPNADPGDQMNADQVSYSWGLYRYHNWIRICLTNADPRDQMNAIRLFWKVTALPHN